MKPEALLRHRRSVIGLQRTDKRKREPREETEGDERESQKGKSQERDIVSERREGDKTSIKKDGFK